MLSIAMTSPGMELLRERCWECKSAAVAKLGGGRAALWALITGRSRSPDHRDQRSRIY